MGPVERILTRNVDKHDSETIAVYEAGGGYQALRKALSGMSPEAVTDEVKKSGLRGRGGAGFPTGLKWTFMPKEVGKKPHYLLCNADESEPGTFKDRLLMERDPHLLLEGCLISSYAIHASVCFIYVRGEYVRSIRVLERAIAEAYARGTRGRTSWGAAGPASWSSIRVRAPTSAARRPR
jgi:NADH-quinone oxidoreductase subunit F